MPKTDLASHAPWLESQRRSRSRRFEAARRLRRLRGRRSVVVVALASLSLATGGAVAADRTGGAAAVRSAGSTSRRSRARSASPPTASTARRPARASAASSAPTASRSTASPARRRSPRSAFRPAARRRPRAPGDAATVLARIAQCESGGDPTAVSADRRYFGKYQFRKATWRAVGGTGNPAAAPEAEQDRRAAILYAARARPPGRSAAAARSGRSRGSDASAASEIP